MILIYITCKDKNEANKISRELINKKLAACTNFFPIESMYRWKGKIVNDKEIVLIVKTQNKNYKKIKELIKKLHSYECPCIIKINAKANKEFENWVKEETKW